jgi:hypothetical protein
MAKHEDAHLILKLYELRREPVMREARNWIIGFFPNSAQEIITAMIDPKTSAYYRMVTTYWDMACSFVNHGAIDDDMFNEVHGEHIVVFSKIEPYLAEVRQILQNPTYLKNLEMLIMDQPNAVEMLAARREMMKRWLQARAEMFKASQG